MSCGIYVLDKDENLIEMREEGYDSENLLQGLLAKYPNLLAGNQMDNLNPRRWLLITREASIQKKSWRMVFC